MKDLSDVEHRYQEPILAARISTLKALAAVDKEKHADRLLHRMLVCVVGFTDVL